MTTRVVAALLLLASLLAGGTANTPAAAAEPVPTVWAFGDSITAGTWLDDPASQSWPAQLDERMGPGQQVRNFGIGGQAVAYADPGGERMVDTVRRNLTATPAAALPKAVVFAGGINDMIRATDVGPTRWAVYELGTWMTTNYPGVRLLVATITPYRSDATWAVPLSARRADYNAWVRDMYGPSGQLIDSGDLITAGATFADIRFVIDFLHPDAEGAAVLAHGIGDALAQKGIT